jgi:hypothetical protein
MDLQNEYIEVIKEKIEEIIKNFDEFDLESFEENFDTLKNIFETYTGNAADLYPYLNKLFKFIYDTYKQDPENDYNIRFLSISGQYVGEVFEFWRDYKSAINAYSYSYFAETDLQSVTKLLKIQILQMVTNNIPLAREIHGIISELSNELADYDYSRPFRLNKKEIPYKKAQMIGDLFIELSTYINDLTDPSRSHHDRQFVRKKIEEIQKKLMIEDVDLYFVNKNIKKMFAVLDLD